MSLKRGSNVQAEPLIQLEDSSLLNGAPGISSTTLTIFGIIAIVGTSLLIGTMIFVVIVGSAMSTDHIKVVNVEASGISLTGYTNDMIVGNMTHLTDDLLRREAALLKQMFDLTQADLNETTCAFTGNVSLLEVLVEHLDGNMTLLNSSLNSIDANITALDATIDSLESSIIAVSNSIGELANRITTLRTQISIIQTNITQLFVLIGQLNITDIILSIDHTTAALDIRFTAAEGELDNLFAEAADELGQLNAMNKSLSNLTIANGNLDLVSSQLTSLINIVSSFSDSGETLNYTSRTMSTNVLVTFIDNSNYNSNYTVTLPDPSLYWMKKYIRLLYSYGHNVTVLTSKGALLLHQTVRPEVELVFTPTLGWIIVDQENPNFYPYKQFGSKISGTGNFGASVAMSCNGNVMAIGAPGLANGTAYTFTRSMWNSTFPSVGVPLAKPTDVGADPAGIASSMDMSCDGRTIVVGAPQDNNYKGAVWVYYDGAKNHTWTQQGTKLVPVDATSSASVGTSIAVTPDGNTMVTGGTNNLILAFKFGGVWVYRRNTGLAWSQFTTNLAQEAPSGVVTNPDYHGTSVDISADGSIVVWGAPNWGATSGDQAGAVFVFALNSAGTDYENNVADLYLRGPGPLNNTDQRGTSVSISGNGDTIAIGMPGYQQNLGAVAVYYYDGITGLWTLTDTLLMPSNQVSLPHFGWTVDLSADGSLLMVGGVFDSSGMGALWTFQRFVYNTGTIRYVEVASKAVGTPLSATGQFGISVAVSADGGFVAVGASGDNPPNNGAAFVMV